MRTMAASNSPTANKTTVNPEPVLGTEGICTMTGAEIALSPPSADALAVMLSGTPAPTEALSRVSMTIVVLAPASNGPIWAITRWPSTVAVPWPTVTFRIFIPAGTSQLTTTPSARAPPSLVTRML